MANKDIKINTSKLFLFNLHHFFKYIFSKDLLLFLVLLSITALFYPMSTLAYIFLSLITLMMVYKLAFDVFADVAQGNLRPSAKHNYLVTNAIAVKVLVVALLIEATLMVMGMKDINEDYKFYFIVFSTFITPAIYMSIALTNSLWVALNPITIFKIIKVTHISYLLFVLFWLGSIQLHEVIINPFFYNNLPVLLDGVFSVFIEFIFLILNFQIMGYIVYQNRAEFDLESLGFDKIEGDEIVIPQVVSNPIYENIKRLLVDDETERVLAIIMELKQDGDQSEELQKLYKIAMHKKLHNPTNLDISKKVHKLLIDKKTSKAFNIVADHLDAGKDYIEESPADINLLLEHAMQVNRIRYIDILVKDFHSKYLYHADIVPNYFLLAKSLYNDRKTRNQSAIILEGLIDKYPADKHIPEIAAWLKGMKLINNREQ